MSALSRVGPVKHPVLDRLDDAASRALFPGGMPPGYLERCLVLLRSGMGTFPPQEIPSGMPVIEVKTAPRNHEHFRRLMAFAGEVLGVCDEVGITPILSASLAVFAYTQDPTIEVHDVDLACSEADFPRLRLALEARGIECRIKPWHVLQAVRNDLRVEFDATEYWMRDIPDRYHAAKIGDVQFRMVGVDGLRELYRRGLADTRDEADGHNRNKHQAIKEKLRALDSLSS